MKVFEWAKAHPYSTGILVVGGGLTFILLSGWFKGNSSGSVTVGNAATGPTDAQLAASTNLGIAQISAGVSAGQTSAGLEAAKLAAQVQQHSDDLAAQIAALQTNAGRDVALATNAAQVTVAGYGQQTDLASIDANKSINLAVIDALKPAPVVTTTIVQGPAAPAAPPPTSPAVYTTTEYLARNPDLAAEAASVVVPGGNNTPQGGFSSTDAYVAWHQSAYPAEVASRGYVAV